MSISTIVASLIIGVTLLVTGLALTVLLPYPLYPISMLFIVPGGMLTGFMATELAKRRRP